MNEYFHMTPLWKSPIKLPVGLPVELPAGRCRAANYPWDYPWSLPVGLPGTELHLLQKGHKFWAHLAHTSLCGCCSVARSHLKTLP